MIYAGFGWRSGAGAGSLRNALGAAVRAAGDALGPETAFVPDMLCAPDDKCETEPLLRLGEEFSRPVGPVSPEDLRNQETPTRSRASLLARGVGSVAEASALFWAGKGGKLVAPRAFSADRLATCAIAWGPAQDLRANAVDGSVRRGARAPDSAADSAGRPLAEAGGARG